MQCKDIPDELVIQAITETPGYWRRWSEVWPRFEALMPGVPFKVFVRKVGAMDPRVHACCTDKRGTCRGDIHLAEECRGC